MKPISTDLENILQSVQLRVDEYLDEESKAHGKQYSPITMMEAQQDVDHLLREDERKLEPPAQKRPVRHQPEPQKKPPKRDYER